MPESELLPKLCGATVEVQRSLWNAVERASFEQATGEQATGEQATGKQGTRSNSLDIVSYAFPYGVPLGCQCVCTAKNPQGSGRWLLRLQLVPLPDACDDSRRAFEEALLHEPLAEWAIPRQPLLAVTQGTGCIRAIGVQSQSARQNAWDIEIWAPGVVNPIYRLTNEQWPQWARRQLCPNGPTDSHAALRAKWQAREQAITQKRIERCERSSRTLLVSDVSARFARLGRIHPNHSESRPSPWWTPRDRRSHSMKKRSADE